MANAELQDLVLQSLEHKRRGALVYETAMQCSQLEDLRQDWESARKHAHEHEKILIQLCAELGIDPETPTPARAHIEETAASLVGAMQAGIEAGDPAGAQLVACECVIVAEVEAQSTWELLGKAAHKLTGPAADALQIVIGAAEGEADRGWYRSLWRKVRGAKAAASASASP